MGFFSELHKELQAVSQTANKEFQAMNKSNANTLRGLNKSNAKLRDKMNKDNARALKEMTSWVNTSLKQEKESGKRKPLSAEMKRKVYAKYNNSCDVCGKRNPLDIHHKNMKRTDDSLGNLRLLCPNHHRLEHQKHFKKIYAKKHRR
jgi:hypothetical protein